jgi:hypothetical protein
MSNSGEDSGGPAIEGSGDLHAIMGKAEGTGRPKGK